MRCLILSLPFANADPIGKYELCQFCCPKELRAWDAHLAAQHELVNTQRKIFDRESYNRRAIYGRGSDDSNKKRRSKSKKGFGLDLSCSSLSDGRLEVISGKLAAIKIKCRGKVFFYKRGGAEGQTAGLTAIDSACAWCVSIPLISGLLADSQTWLGSRKS